MDFPLWLWAVPAATFVILEVIALVNKRRGDTASELLRRLAGITPARPWRPIGVAVVTGLLAWLAYHLVAG